MHELIIERLDDLSRLAHQIAAETAWTMALSGKNLPEEFVHQMELETLAELLAGEADKPAHR